MAYGMTGEYLSEADFLMKFVVTAYNNKYKRKLNYLDCKIKSKKPACGYKYGYQILTARNNDDVKIDLYINLGPLDRVDIVRVENVQNVYAAGSLGDEIYVVTGEVSRFYKDEGIYKFRWISDTGYSLPSVTWMDDDIILFMDGNFLAWMNNVASPPIEALIGTGAPASI